MKYARVEWNKGSVSGKNLGSKKIERCVVQPSFDTRDLEVHERKKRANFHASFRC